MSIFGSMKTAVSGMNAQANRLSTVADNIANANTVGYKSASVAFSTLVMPGSSGSFNSGGVESTTRDSITTEGNYTSTTSSTDLSIKGDGFFIVQAADGTTALTRAGDFLPDDDGNLKNTAQYMLMGYPYTSGAPSVVVNGFDGLVPINVTQKGLTAIPSSTGYFQGTSTPMRRSPRSAPQHFRAPTIRPTRLPTPRRCRSSATTISATR